MASGSHRIDLGVMGPFDADAGRSVTSIRFEPFALARGLGERGLKTQGCCARSTGTGAEAADSPPRLCAAISVHIPNHKFASLAGVGLVGVEISDDQPRHHTNEEQAHVSIKHLPNSRRLIGASAKG